MKDAPQLTELSNGLRIVTGFMPGMSSVSIGAWVGVGSRYEEERLGGVSHFLEHLLFKGTRTRSAKQITEEIEGLGGNINAFTSEEHTCYTTKVPHKHLSKGVEILADMLLNSTLDPKEIERERGVIQEEMNMVKDNPSEYVQDLLGRLLWPDHPLGRMIIGTSESIQRMTRKEILDYKNLHYTTENMVVAAAGHLQHKEFVAMVKKWFSKTPPGVPDAFETVLLQEHTSPEASVHSKKTDQTHVAVAFPAYARNHPDRAVLKVLNVILGGNMSSRLFQEVREKRGFAYDISSSVNRYHDAGSLVIYAGTEAKKLLDCLSTISSVIADIQERPVGRQELERAKEYATGHLTLRLEKTMEHMLWLGESVISEQEVPHCARLLKEIETVSAGDILRVAKSIFRRNALRVQAIGTGLSEKKMLDRLTF